ncbi:MAG TPA: SCO family protein [Polyangiaceae bacterium]|nr:SCO family protein [Polyangiaceae bacterium]
MQATASELSRRRLLWLLGSSCGVLFGACKRSAELPELGGIGAFSLTDQAGRAVTAESLRGRVWAAAFMFTRCPTVCPRITRRMRDLQRAAKNDGIELDLVSFSVDPEHDTPEVLRAYAQKYEADLESWRFLTGDLEVVRRTSEQGFKLALQGKPTAGVEHFGLMHGSHLVLVDRAGQIRGYYRTSEDEAMKQLLSDAEALG